MTSFNLWEDPWIRTLSMDGSRVELGIRDLLISAHELRGLYDPSPLTVAGIHRLLVAVVQAMYDAMYYPQPLSLDNIADLLEAGQFSLAKVEEFGKQHGARFELFDPAAPFLQTSDAPSVVDKSFKKTVAYLLAEVPSATNRTHFYHVTDADHRLCPACCARSLVTVPAFASSGGSGIRPSINGVPPIYLLPVGDTLAQSLMLSITTPEYQPKVAARERRQVAAWNGATVIPRATETSAVGYIESLTFPARRMRLYRTDGMTRCTRCGMPTEIAVSDILFEMGLSRPKGTELWKDPFAAFYIASTTEVVSVKPKEGRALWREYGTLFLSDGALRPAILSQLHGLVDDGVLPPHQRFRFRCIGLRTDGKAKIFEWLDEALDVPPVLLQDPAGAELVREALRRADETNGLLRELFTKHLRPSGSERTWFNSLRDRMLANYWTSLALPFREFTGSAVDAASLDALSQWWAKRVLETAEQVGRDALAQLSDDAELLRRRVFAEDRLRAGLNKRRKEWISG